MKKELLWITKDASSEELSRSARAEETQIRQHVQRTRVESNDTKRRPRGHRALVPLPLPAPAIDLNAAEKRSLSYFIQRTGPDWCGWQDDDFWNGLVL